VEERRLAARHALARGRQQRPQEPVDVLRRAVIGVHGDGDGERGGELAGQRRERPGPGRRVARRAGEVARASDGDLDDAVRARLGEAAHGRVERLRGRDVDRGEREPAGRGAVEHRRVLLSRRKHRVQILARPPGTPNARPRPGIR